MNETDLAKRKRIRRRVLVGVVVLAVVLVALRAWREFRLVVSLQQLSVTFDESYRDPRSFSRLRVRLTDQGALGYGCAFFYRYSVVTGYGHLATHCEVVASEPVTVTWLEPGTCEVSFVDPRRGPVTLTLQP